MALESINNAGGVNGTKVKVIYEDDQANPKVGVNAFKKLVDIDRVPIVVGSPASGVTLSVAAIANEKQVVLLSSGSTATDVGKAGPYVFRIMPSDEVQSSIISEWALELGLRRIAVIYVENSWGKGLTDAFEKDFETRGGEILTIQSATQEATDFRTQLTKIKQVKPDAIYAPLYTRGAGLMIKQARELGLKQQILGADVYGTPELVQAGGTAVEGVLYTTFGEYRGPEFQDIAKKYKEIYKMDMETYATYCYDAFMIALEAIRQIPKTEIDGQHIRQALLSIQNYRGITGVTTFAGRNSAIGKTFDKMMVLNGKHIPFDPEQLALSPSRR
jgi:branched-chain amino acid transport system substrate-binding protein